MINLRSLLVLVITLAGSGCVLFANKADYAGYRAVRLAPDAQARALAMQDYIDKHPTGHWADEVQAARKGEDTRTFEAGKDSRAGLEHYLQAYPDGQFVAQARSRLQAIGLIEQQRKAASEQAQQLSAARKARADELRRTWLGRFMGYWLRTLATLHGWGEPIPEVAKQNPQFSRAFGALPRPRCTQDECVKYYTSSYAVPVPGGNRLERTLSLLLRLRMKAGKLDRAELLLPDRGFSRWYEVENRKPVSEGDRESRIAAVAWALERALPDLRGLGDAFAEAPRNAVPASPPVIEAPAIGPTGELIDTSIEAPSDPQNRVSGEPDNAGIGAQTVKQAPNTVEDLVKPEAPAPAADMVFTPLGVGKRGQRVEVEESPKAPAAEGGSDMTFTAPLAVPESGAVETAPAPAPAEQATAIQPIKPEQRVFLGSGLRITLLAAGSDGQACDGLVIERVTPKKVAAAKPAAQP